MIDLKRIVVVLFACSALAAHAADSIAFLSNVKGEVVIDGAQRAPILAELARGQRLTVGRDALATVMFIASGKEYSLKGPADYVVKDNEVAGSMGIPPVVRNTEWRASSRVLGQIAQASAASVRMRSLAAAKPLAATRLLFPTEGSISTLQPTFEWAMDGAQQGELMVMVPGEDRPVHRALVSGGSYRFPGPLQPQTGYAWTLAVGGQEIGTGRFRTLGVEAMRTLEMRRPSERSDFSDRVLFALMLQEMGAVQEAQRSWARLSRERGDLPELSALAR